MIALAEPTRHNGAIVDLRADVQRMADEQSIDAFAARDRDPPRERWLTSILDGDEPDDDDSAEWIIRDVVPRSEPFIWAGPPKAGKTWAVLDLAICVAAGLPWLGFENTLRAPARVLVVALEDSRRRLARRVWELARGRGLTPRDPLLAGNLIVTSDPLRLPMMADEDALAAQLAKWRPALVLVDSLARVLIGDENKTADAAAFTRPWLSLCRGSGAAIGFLHHTAKPSEGGARDPFDRIRGSRDFLAAARNAIVSVPIEGTESVSAVRIRGNLEIARPSFALGFERTRDPGGRWQASMTDRGEVEEVVKAARERRQREVGDDIGRRRLVALRAAGTGLVSITRAHATYVAAGFTVSEGTAEKDLRALATGGLVRRVKGQGSELTEAGREVLALPDVAASERLAGLRGGSR